MRNPTDQERIGFDVGRDIAERFADLAERKLGAAQVVGGDQVVVTAAVWAAATILETLGGVVAQFSAPAVRAEAVEGFYHLTLAHVTKRSETLVSAVAKHGHSG